jgi:L-ascorbate metabolism protein UlaG (beta-lactamase superfamily)
MVTALPAVDGLGDPQLSWAVRASDRVVAHFGDTMFHGYWWRIRERVGPIDVALMPINGPALDLPHTQPPSPLSSALTPEQAVVAAGLLRARVVVPIHYEGFDVDERYTPVRDALSTFVAAAAAAGVKVRVLDAGESLDLAALA